MANHNLHPSALPAMPGLDLFAGAWVDRWLASGGAVHVDVSAQLSTPAQIYAREMPGYEPPPAQWTDAQRRTRNNLDDIALSVRQRELLALLEAVPGGRRAVAAHVRQWPSQADSEGGCALA